MHGQHGEDNGQQCYLKQFQCKQHGEQYREYQLRYGDGVHDNNEHDDVHSNAAAVNLTGDETVEEGLILHLAANWPDRHQKDVHGLYAFCLQVVAPLRKHG